ncbi:tumor necrosis factor receptor superfamily member 1B-like, partial [Mustelus asterias]
VPGSGIPYSPSNKGCEVKNTYREESVNLCCSKCPPGTFQVRSCSGLQDTICLTCPFDTYTEVWNSISGCISCRGTCKAEHGLIQLQECTRTTRRRCICHHGTYCQPGVEASDTTCSHCVPHSPCGPGLGVTMPGNYSANTVCRACPSGTFSDITSATQRCQIHTNCSSLGKFTSRRGNATADSGCDDLMDGQKRILGQEYI